VCVKGEPDLIVVGGGSRPGSRAPRGWPRAGLRVLLVEAGRDHHDPRLAIPR
jgi:choline dehydrogenase-like flavoprotein